jgi:hypothetical protein
VRNYHNAGKVQASSEPQDMRLQRMLGHITHLIPTNPSNVPSSGAARASGAVSIGPRSSMRRSPKSNRLSRPRSRAFRAAQLRRRHQPEGDRTSTTRGTSADDERSSTL